MNARISAIAALLVGLAVAVSAMANDEADELIPGKTTVIKPAKLAKVISKGTFALPTAANDPTVEGATLRIFDTVLFNGVDTGAGDNTYNLPAGGWSSLNGNGFKYKGAGTPGDPCKVVLVKPTLVKAVCKGADVTLVPPFVGQVGVILTVGTDSKRYCAAFGGTLKKNDVKIATFKDATAPGACPVVTGNEIGTQECTLVSGATASRVKLNAGTLPFPAFPMSGSVEVSCGAVADGEASCSCAVKNLDPINIPGIGFVCISASADPCPDGKIACDGGTSLGVSVQANGNVGTCDGNAACDTLCESRCTGLLGLEVASAPQCTGFCNGGERDGQSCNCDTAGARCQGDDCPGGACNGPDNAQANPGICQCQCIDRSAGAEQRKGEMSCNLPVTLVIETGAPCGNGDVLINVGSACSPLTTSAASSVIDNANYIAGNIVPAGPCENNEGTPQTPTVLCNNASSCLNPEFPVCGAGPAMSDGSPLSCEVLHNSASGLKLRGMLSFFGSTLGDLVSELYVDCQ